MIVFKRATVPKQLKVPRSIVVYASKGGSTNSKLITKWTSDVVKAKVGPFYRSADIATLRPARGASICTIQVSFRSNERENNSCPGQMHTSFATIELRRECRFQTAHA
jgi:hypothetical protein